MKISKAEMRILVNNFKLLVEKDIVGITSSDARDTIERWLMDVGQIQTSDDFAKAVYKYQTSKKIRNMEERYNSSGM